MTTKLDMSSINIAKINVIHAFMSRSAPACRRVTVAVNVNTEKLCFCVSDNDLVVPSNVIHE